MFKNDKDSFFIYDNSLRKTIFFIKLDLCIILKTYEHWAVFGGQVRPQNQKKGSFLERFPLTGG